MDEELLIATRLSGKLRTRWEAHTTRLEKDGTALSNSDLLRVAVDVYLAKIEKEGCEDDKKN